MSLRHLLDRLLGSEDSARRRALGALSWTLRTPFRDHFDSRKCSLFKKVRSHTMVGYRRLSNVYDVCRDIIARSVDGAFVECGVWKGGAAGVMASIARDEGKGRRTWLFDSFEGLPAPTSADGPDAVRYAGKCVAPLDEVERLLFETLALDRATVSIRKGWFQDTLPAARAEVGPIAVLRLDADWYDSTRQCLETLYDRVVPGGAVILDDYGFWGGFRRAVDEFIASRGLKIEFQPIDRSGAWFIIPG